MTNNVYIHAMIKACISALFLLLYLQSNAQLGTTPLLGAKSLSLGNTGAAADGIQSIYFGHAGLSSIDKLSVEVSTEQRFTLSDLTVASAALAFRAGNYGAVGFFISNYGLEEYKEQKFGISYAKFITGKISIGAQWSLNTIRIDEYGSTSFFGLELGIIGYLSDKFSVGVHLSNPVKRDLLGDESISQLINFGFKYDLSEKIGLYSDFRMISDYDNSFHFGLDYNISEPLNFRIGIDTGSSSFSFGLAYNLNQQASIHGGFSNHQYLGVTPALSVSYEK